MINDGAPPPARDSQLKSVFVSVVGYNVLVMISFVSVNIVCYMYIIFDYSNS
jgi:hypothetical protein